MDTKVDSPLVISPEIYQIELNVYVTCWLDPKSKSENLAKKFGQLANLVLSLAQISTTKTRLMIFTNKCANEFESVISPLKFKANSLVEICEVPREGHAYRIVFTVAIDLGSQRKNEN